MVVHDALDEEYVVEDDGPSKARRYVNPVTLSASFNDPFIAVASHGMIVEL